MTDPHSFDVYSLIREGWFQAHKLEKPQREEWNKLEDWTLTSEQLPVLDERVLIRESEKHKPCIGWRETLMDRVIWCALFDGDLWPMNHPPKYWRPLPPERADP